MWYIFSRFFDEQINGLKEAFIWNSKIITYYAFDKFKVHILNKSSFYPKQINK